MVEGLEMTCFRIVFNVGGACSNYIRAIQKAKRGDSESARECIRTGQEMLLAGHEARFELIQKETQGEQVGGPMILVHTENQLMSVEGFKITAREMLVSYEWIAELEKRLEDR